MKVVTVRKVGNSNVVSIPAEMERLGYTTGISVMIDALPDGDLKITPVTRVREAMQRAISTVVEEDREALDLLKAHDHSGDSAPGEDKGD